jgi:hypothetical protein
MVAIKVMQSPQDRAEEVLNISGDFGDEAFSLVVRQSEVLEVVRSRGNAGRAVEELLDLGARVTLAARAGLSTRDFQRDLENAVVQTLSGLESLGHDMKEAVGADGIVVASLKGAMGSLTEVLHSAIAAQADPQTAGSLLARVQGEAKAFSDILTSNRKEIVDELRRSAEGHSERMHKAMQEMRDLDPASALGAKLNSIEAGLRDVYTALAANQAASEIHQRPSEGRSYEACVAETLGEIARRAGDSAEHTGDHPGYLRSKTRLAKRGDVTCRIGGSDNVRIVLEAMDRDKARLTRAMVEQELGEAKINRGASMAIAVVPGADSSLMCFQPFQDLGQNNWAVVLPREPKDKSDALALELVYHLARQRAAASATPSGVVDVALISQLTEEIREKLGLCIQIKQHMDNAGRSQEEATSLVKKLEREIRDHIQILLDSLRGERPPDEEASG